LSLVRKYTLSNEQIRCLNISDTERIERFRKAGYGGSVSDSLARLGVFDTVLSQRFRPLRQGMQIVGRALTVKLHTYVIDDEATLYPDTSEKLYAKLFPNGHPQKKIMRAVEDHEDGTVLCFDCGGDMQPAHFGEMSCHVSYSHGCRGMLIAGNCRDTQYVLKMEDFPVFLFGTTPNAFGGWIVTDVDVPIMLPGHLTYYVRVFPGDFVFGDNDGVQIIPGKIVDEILLRVEEIYEHERKEREMIAQGISIDEVYRRFGVL